MNASEFDDDLDLACVSAIALAAVIRRGGLDITAKRKIFEVLHQALRDDHAALVLAADLADLPTADPR